MEKDKQKNESLVFKNNIPVLNNINNSIAITRKIVPIKDELYDELCNLNNIENAYDLVKHARLNGDTFVNYFEFSFSKDQIATSIFKRLKERNFDFNDLNVYSYSIPKNKTENRIFYYLHLEIYVIQYLIAKIVFKYTDRHLMRSVFAGRNKVFDFSLQNDFDEIMAEEYFKWTHENLIDGPFNFALVLDIEQYYDSIEINKLITLLSNKLNVETNSDFLQLLKQTLCFNYSILNNQSLISYSKDCGLPTGQRCSNYFGNIFLADVDKIIAQNCNIVYGRMTDDIRIFAQTEEELKEVNLIVETQLNLLGLKLNKKKTKVLKKSDDDIVKQLKSYVAISGYGVIYTGTNGLSKDEMLSEFPFFNFHTGINPDEIGDGFKLAFDDYCKFVFRKIPNGEDAAQVSSMDFIVRNIIGNENSFKLAAKAFVHSLYVEVKREPHAGGEYWFQYLEMCELKYIALLKDSSLCSYIKYCLLKSLFIDNEEYPYIDIFRLGFVTFKNEITQYLKECTNNNDFLLNCTSEYILNNVINNIKNV